MKEYIEQSSPITVCQICLSASLKSVLFLGYIPPVNSMEDIQELAKEQPAFPLELLRCSDCGLVQIGLEVDVEVLFPYSYPYLSGTTKILRKNFSDLLIETKSLNILNEKDLVVDIGSNDGTLLKNFLESDFRVLGIEPSKAGEVAREIGVETITAYFNHETVSEVIEKYGKAKVITAANVFAHISKPHEVVESVVELLDEKGVFISESHYLLSLIETLQYDTIYHEHLRYYHLGVLKRLFEKHDLEIFKVKRIPTHGGSIRVYAARKNAYEIDSSVNETINEEDNSGITDGSALDTFRNKVIMSKLEFHKLITDIKEKGERIYGIGAPSRASTLINYIGIDDGMIDCVMEVSGSHKLNKYVPGTRIPVLDEKKLYEDQPEYALLLSWHIANDLIKIIKKNGYRGKFIIPLPEPVIIE